MELVLFSILAFVAAFSALAVVTRATPFASALWLVVCMVSVAGLFALLAMPFVAAVQLLISAGAVMVMFVFVVMLVDHAEEKRRGRVIGFLKVIGSAAAVYLTSVFVLSIVRQPFAEAPQSGQSFEAPMTLSRVLVSNYAVAFELVGVLLMTAVVAMVALRVENTSCHSRGSRREST